MSLNVERFRLVVYRRFGLHFGRMAETRPQENFSVRKAIETLVIAVLVALISIAFNLPPAEALITLNQRIAAFTQLLTSTGLIALLEFWYKALLRRTQLLQTRTQ